MDRLKVEIDIKQVTAALDGLSSAAMQAAWRRTLRKTAAWIKSQTSKEVSAATKIPQKVIKSRLYFFLRSADTGKVWLGLNPVEAHRIGTVTKTGKGMRAGRFGSRCHDERLFDADRRQLFQHPREAARPIAKAMRFAAPVGFRRERERVDVGDDRNAERRGDGIGQIVPADAREVDDLRAPGIR